MKIRKIERWLLLEQSGELSARRRNRLARELARSQTARRLRDELRLLNESVCEADADVSPRALTRMNARLRDETNAGIVFSNAWKPALAFAACLIMALGLWTFQGKQVPAETADVQTESGSESALWDDPLGEDLSELEDLIVALSDTSFDIMEM